MDISQLQVQLVGVGGMDVGSSRLRLHRPMRMMGDKVEIIDRPDDQPAKCDLLFVQKRADSIILKLVDSALEQGIPVLYDIDDDHVGACPDLMRKATRVLVDCAGRASYVRKSLNIEASVMEPCIDYLDGPPAERADYGTSVVTFGNPPSIEAASGLLRSLHKDGISVASIGLGNGGIPGAFHRWELSSFLRTLQEYSVCVIAYKGDGSRKCFNRVLAPCSVGMVPVILDGGDSSSREFVSRMGLSWLACSSEAEAKKLLLRLRDPKLYEDVSETVFRYVWERHHPSLYAKKLLWHIRDMVARKVLSKISEDRNINYHGYRFGVQMYEKVLSKAPSKIVELGTGKGYTTCVLALAASVSDGRVITYDYGPPNPPGGRQSGGFSQDQVKANLRTAGVEKLVDVRAGAWQDWCREPDPFDFLYVDVDNDGDKLRTIAEAVQEQLRRGIPMLFEGGTEERDNVPWMKGRKTPIRTLQEYMPYTVLFEPRPGLSCIDLGKPKGKPLSIVVLSANFGFREDMYHNKLRDPRCHYVYYTDIPNWPSGWTVRGYPDSAPKGLTKKMQAKYFKVMACSVFPDADYIFWVDAPIRINTSSLYEIIEKVDPAVDLFVDEHPGRNCLFDEAMICRTSKLDDGKVIDEHCARYRAEKMPTHWGLWNCGRILWKNTPKTRELQKLWWEEIQKGSKRDQISFPYVLRKLGMRPSPLPTFMGQPIVEGYQARWAVPVLPTEGDRTSEPVREPLAPMNTTKGLYLFGSTFIREGDSVLCLDGCPGGDCGYLWSRQPSIVNTLLWDEGRGPDTYDVVLCFDLLDRTKDDLKLLRAIVDKCKGTLVVSFTNDRDGEHIRQYPPLAYENLIRSLCGSRDTHLFFGWPKDKEQIFNFDDLAMWPTLHQRGDLLNPFTVLGSVTFRDRR